MPERNYLEPLVRNNPSVLFRLGAPGLALTALVLGACGGDAVLIDLTGDGAVTVAGDGGGGGGDAGAVDGVGLPCEIAQLLASRCASCHGSPPSGGASMSLLTRADLVKPSYKDAKQSFAQRAVARMQSNQMPPGGGVSPAELTSFTKWVDQGLPAGTCGQPGSDGGVTPDPLNAAPTCTSGSTSPMTIDNATAAMNPGMVCISCHVKEGGPPLIVGGTVYPTGHEPDLCDGNGATPPLSTAHVIITGANGQSVTLPVGSTGNFSLRSGNGTIALPYTAKLIWNNKTRAMSAAQSSGDCNACHTQMGAMNAPGRITLPAP